MLRTVALLLVLTIACACASGPLHAQTPVGGATFPRIVVPRADAALRARCERAGCVRARADYGGFLIYEIDAREPEAAALLGAAAGARRDDFDFIRLGDLTLDARDPAALLTSLPPALVLGLRDATALPPEAGLYLVWFTGPIRAAWLDRLTGAGATIVQAVPTHAFVVRVAPHRVSTFAAWARTRDEIGWVGAWQPAFRLAPRLRERALAPSDADLAVVVQVVADDPHAAAVHDALDLAIACDGAVRVGPYVDLFVTVRPERLVALARHPLVFSITERGVAVRSDERQAMIVAGATSAGLPAPPDYATRLAAAGFGPGQFTTFAVNVVDDAVSLLGHPDLTASRVAFAQNPSGQVGLESGHGFLNAQVLAGSGAGGLTDVGGYAYGLGIAPWVRVGSTAIFGPGFGTPVAWEAAAWGLDARISTNSWNLLVAGAPATSYDAFAQMYDAIVRDAAPALPGAQPLVVAFSAGNDGPGPDSVSSPATAKNVLTVGASENVRPFGTDGCGFGNDVADDARDLWSGSGRGPVNAAGGDGRIKPELVAPGTHVQGGVPFGNYSGLGLCDFLFPSGQILYSWGTGTSHAVPAVAGAAALLRQRFLNDGRPAPGPALTKALLLSSARYLTGAGGSDDLPSPAQGLGRLDVGHALAATPRFLIDESVVLDDTGETWTVAGVIADPSRPLRVTLAWTDAPGSTIGGPWVNDLDLTVTVGGATYRGNVFGGATSVTGGATDFRNNHESVFLPAGTTGPWALTITAANLAGDGVPGVGDGTDQDFALAVENTGPAAPPRRIYVSFADDVTLPGIGLVADEDIAFVDTDTGQWGLHLDGSDLGLAGTDVTAFHVFAGGAVLFAVADASVSLPGLLLGPSGADVTHNDLVFWAPTAIGATSAGPLYFAFDGSDVLLDTPAEAVDSLFAAPDASFFVLGTAGAATVGGGVGADPEDLLLFWVQELLAATAGTFYPAFDGSDVGLDTPGENVNGIDFDVEGALFFSTSGALGVPGVTAAAADVTRFLGSYGTATSGALDPRYALALLGAPAGADVDGLTIRPLP